MRARPGFTLTLEEVAVQSIEDELDHYRNECEKARRDCDFANVVVLTGMIDATLKRLDAVTNWRRR